MLYGEGGGREHYCTAGLGSAVAVQHGSLPEEGRQRQPPRSGPPSSRAQPSRVETCETCGGEEITLVSENLRRKNTEGHTCIQLTRAAASHPLQTPHSGTRMFGACSVSCLLCLCQYREALPRPTTAACTTPFFKFSPSAKKAGEAELRTRVDF